MKIPHKHAALIKAWADGEEIECKQYKGDIWVHIPHPDWDLDLEYRIKPEPKPDNAQYVWAHKMEESCAFISSEKANNLTMVNLKLTFDGETGKLKTAEVIE